MQFVSIDFFVFLLVAFTIHWLMPKRACAQNVAVIAAGCMFYSLWDWHMLGLFAGSVLVTYFAAISGRKILLVVAIVLLIGILGVFKYANFFLASFGVNRTLSLVLPLGISFYTFMLIGYLVDVYRGNRCETDFLAFASFMMFFPQIAAGPIGRVDRMLPQYRMARYFDYPLAVEGCRQMLWGYFKKILVADTCAICVGNLLVPSQTSAIALWSGAILVTIQIYADFSGYSDIAIGCGKLFGIRLMRNFNCPYFEGNIADFWRNWHISLTSWFRDYVYIPLGGGRCRLARKIGNTMAVFLLSGLWHGANWTFVAWGGLHGLFFIPILVRGKAAKPMSFIISWPLTMLAVIVGWMFFFAPSISVALQWIKGMFVPIGCNIHGLGLGSCALAFLFGAIMLVVEYIGRRREVIPFPKLAVIRWLCYSLIVVGIFWFYPVSNTFIYFQF